MPTKAGGLPGLSWCREIWCASILLVTIALLFPAGAYAQSLISACETTSDDTGNCPISIIPTRIPLADHLAVYDDLIQNSLSQASSPASEHSFPDVQIHSIGNEGFHWSRALTESFTFLLIEQAYVVRTDFRWVISENGIPFNHYWRDYKQSLSEWTQSGWDDGDPNWFGYIGHPIQGALTGFIQIQNDPKSKKLEFSKTKAYWKSRLKAALWNAVYSTQWNLGPLSEVTVEKYGSKDRQPWNANGSFPCNTNHCYTGVGQIDVVMTPLGGMGWLIGEDFLDKKVVRRVEESTQNRLLIDTVRVALNPIRAGANMLHGEHPWYRASRDDGGMSFLPTQKTPVPTDDTKTPLPNHGNLFFGYSHTGPSHCEVVINGAATICDPLSSVSSNLSGWDTSVEKMYLRYFGAVADFSGQYGGGGQSNFLFGIRGGASIGRFRPFAHAMIGAVREHGNTLAGSMSDTNFAEDLGLGLDFRLLRRLSWRNQVDSLKTGSPEFQRRNLRLSSGFAVRF
ncbi:MAG: hypothetical protein WAL56_12725 [Candidatus Sulfotelmatobacter sp.]